ncbi:MAG: hypothetical protein ACHQ49_12220 [Elusimicrobiota bacterium]
MRFPLSAVFLVLASGAYAAEGMLSFGAVNFAEFAATRLEIATPRILAGDVLSSYYMIPQAGKNSLIGRAENQAEADEAISYWTGVLKTAGIQTGAATFQDGQYEIPYKTADGRVVRDFIADSRQFPPKDEAGLRSNMASTTAALKAAGLGVVSAHVLNVDALLPTYSILYLTAPNEVPEHETRLRLLKPEDEFDSSVYRDAGIDVVQTPVAWMMVYIGPEVGYVSLIARTHEELDAKVSKRREFLAGEGKKLIAERRENVDDADYKFGAALYFFQ